MLQVSYPKSEINGVLSLNIRGRILAYFDDQELGEAVVVQARNATLTVVPGKDHLISGEGEAIGGKWYMQVMHPSTSETRVEQNISGEAATLVFYVNEHIVFSYRDADDKEHTAAPCCARVKVVKSDAALKIMLTGDLSFSR